MKKIITEQQLFEFIENSIQTTTQNLLSHFSISVSTLNRLLKILRQKNLIVTHNQYIIYKPITHFLLDTSLIEGAVLDMYRKNTIARNVSTYIQDGQTIGLSGGSTSVALLCPYIIMYKKNITLISNSILVLKIFLDLHPMAKQNNISLLTIGGKIQEELFSFGGEYSKDILSRFYIDCTYIGIESINLDTQSLYTNLPQEIEIDLLMMESSQKNYILCLKEKFTTSKLYKWCSLDKIDGIFSDYPEKNNELFHYIVI